MNIKAAWKALFDRKAASYWGSTAVQSTTAQVVWVGDTVQDYIVNGYSANDVVYAITFITGEKIKVAPWNVYQIKDESSLKLMQAEYKQGVSSKNFKKILDLRTKALELYEGDDRLNELLKWPNDNETFSDLVAHSSIAKMITGNRYLRATINDGGANMGKPFDLEQLPPQFTNIISSSTFPVKSIGYQLSCGTILNFRKEEVMHDKYYNPLYDINGAHLYGMAPLKSARYTLTNDNSSMEASTKSFQNQGPGGVMYIDDDRLTGPESAEQAAATKRKWIEEYQGSEGNRKIAVSGYKVGFAEMGLSPVDLNILAQQKWNLVRFCNVWNFPHPLLLPDHLTDNNYESSERALVSRCALPLMTSFRDNFNRKLSTDWGYTGKNIYVDFDLSVYSEMQQDQGKLTDWLMKAWHLTPRMRYELQQLDVPEQYQKDPMIDKIFVPSGFQVLEQLDPANMENEMDRIDREMAREQENEQ